MALQQRREQAEPVAVSVINRLTWRAGTGDEVLAQALFARLRGEPLTGRVVPVDLVLGTELEGIWACRPVATSTCSLERCSTTAAPIR